MLKSLTILAFDYGTRRVGVAVGNSLAKAGQALKSIAAPSSDALFQEIERLVKEWQPDEFVVGKPVHVDGAPHEMTAKAVRFGNQLHGRFHLPVHWVDERYTSVVLEGDPRAAENLDAHSAAVILEQFFAEKNLKPVA